MGIASDILTLQLNCNWRLIFPSHLLYMTSHSPNIHWGFHRISFVIEHNYNLAKRKGMQANGGVFALTPPTPADSVLPNFNHVQICCSEGTGGHSFEFYFSISSQKQRHKLNNSLTSLAIYVSDKKAKFGTMSQLALQRIVREYRLPAKGNTVTKTPYTFSISTISNPMHVFNHRVCSFTNFIQPL